MFNLGTIAPLGVHRFGISDRTDSDVGERGQIVVQVWVMGNQGPQHLLRFGEADRQPARSDPQDPYYPGIGGGHTKLQGQRYAAGRIVP